MVEWRDYLTAPESERLDELKAETRKLKAEHRRIYDRCRKRMGTKAGKETPKKNAS